MSKQVERGKESRCERLAGNGAIASPKHGEERRNGEIKEKHVRGRKCIASLIPQVPAEKIKKHN